VSDAIVVKGLIKRYRHRRGRTNVAVDGLDLAVPSGGVFGFLGPNGSGKTTTIRCLLGLVRPTGGTMTVLGRPVPDQLSALMGSIGSVVENAPLIPSMTAREQLRLLADLDRIPHAQVDAVLERVGLAGRAREQTKRYSLGMRQRFALAAALLKDPEVLILDEPANGLDPAGMRDLRILLRTLGDEGRTVFVSSHLLTEIEQMCDTVAIVNRGRLVASGRVDDVVRRGRTSLAVAIAPGKRDVAVRVLEGAGLRVERSLDGLVVHETPGEEVAAVLGAAGVWPSALVPQRQSLESMFLELTTELGTEEAVA
jgi:ABC-type multidrug transport system ATPase subunit